MNLSRRDFLAGLSYSFLCFLPALTRLGNSSLNYFRSGETFYRIFLPILVLQAALLLTLLATYLLCRKLPQPFRNLAFLTALCWPAAAIAQTVREAVGPPSILQKYIAAALLLALILLAYSLARSLNRLSGWATSFLLFVAPGSIALCLYAGLSSFYYSGLFQDQTPKPQSTAHRAIPVRVVWIVFDELDYDILTTNRPTSLKLPNFDRLIAQSFSATDARQPGAKTRDSIPALITGRDIAETRPTGPNDLTLVWKNGLTSLWRNTPGVFDDASQRGINTAVAGWYHPYSRVLGQRVNHLEWKAAEDVLGLDNQNPAGPLLFPWKQSRTREQLLDSITELPGIGKTPWFQKNTLLHQKHLKRFEYLHRTALQLAPDDTFGLVFLHLPVPHPPGIWNRHTGNSSISGRSYLDNVALADLVLGDVMQCLNLSGESRNTALLVTADHGWRRFLWKVDPGWTKEDEATAGKDVPDRVPFILHMPGETSPLSYTKSFSAVLTRRIIDQIFSGQLKTVQDTAAWLDRTANQK